MEYKDFHYACCALKEFMEEQKKLDAVLKVISPSTTGVCEYGNKFIDDYIKVVEIALGAEFNSFSWFVFENDFGKNKRKVKIDDKMIEICDEKQFFNACIALKG
jgi:hypothetical protein